MSLGDMIPLEFYQLAFFVTILSMPVLAWQADVETYIFGAIVLYMCYRIIRKRLQKSLPADGKAVFITGCDTGFGHMAAVRLHSKGYKVFAGCLHPEGPGATELNEKCPDNMHVVSCDVTDEASIHVARELVENDLGDTRLWAIVSNAGIFGLGDVELCSLETFQKVMDVNMLGMIRVTKTFLPLIRKSKGRVVVMSSTSALFPWPSSAAYNCSKAALEIATGCLRIEMKRFGVKVTSVQPAMFGGSTEIHSQENVARYKAEADTCWDQLSDEVKDSYHRKYLESQVQLVVSNRKSMDAKSPDPVIDAVETGVSAANPEASYIVHGGPFYVDPIAIFASLYAILPAFITDWFACATMGIHPQQPDVTSSDPAVAQIGPMKAE